MSETTQPPLELDFSSLDRFRVILLIGRTTSQRLSPVSLALLPTVMDVATMDGGETDLTVHTYGRSSGVYLDLKCPEPVADTFSKQAAQPISQVFAALQEAGLHHVTLHEAYAGPNISAPDPDPRIACNTMTRVSTLATRLMVRTSASGASGPYLP
jgi:hypothetical protein